MIPVEGLDGYTGELQWVTEVSDAVVDEFRDLKKAATSRGELPCTIIAEGPETLRLLLASNFAVEKVLLKPSAFAGLRPSLEERASCARDAAPVLVLLCEHKLMEQITGVPPNHASASLACARRSETLNSSINTACHQLHDPDSTLRALLLDGVDEEGIGSLLRIGSAFGVNAVFLSERCGDAFHRRAVRVSMGHVFRVPLFRVELQDAIRRLRTSGVATVALASHQRSGSRVARPLEELAELPKRWACVIGPEGPVHSDEVLDACDMPAFLDTVPGCSLGVGVVAGILLNGCTEREQK